MKIKIILSILFLCLVGCGGGGSSSKGSKPSLPTTPDQPVNPEQPPARDSDSENSDSETPVDILALTGTWEGEASGCPISYEFRSDGSFTLVVTGMTVKGPYVINEVPNELDLYTVDLTNNRLAENSDTCNGISFDENDFPSGSTETQYIRLYENTLSFYSGSDFNNPIAEFYRSSGQPPVAPPTNPDSPTNSSGVESMIKNTFWASYDPSINCTEAIAFVDGNRIIGITLYGEESSEELFGTYSLGQQVSNNRYAFELNIQQDNGQPDCYGSSEDDSGVYPVFIEATPDQLDIYESANSTEPLFSYKNEGELDL